MAQETVYIGSVGPFLFDNSDTYEDGQAMVGVYASSAKFGSLYISSSLVFDNTAALQWKTAGDTEINILTLGADDTLVIGSSNADGVDDMRWDLQSAASQMVLNATGLAVTARLTADNIVCTNAATFGGGYGAAGATISTAGVGQFNGALTTEGALTADNLVCTNAATFGGGYGFTGATISTAGVGQFNGALTTDGLMTAGSISSGGAATVDSLSVGGGYGSTGVTISSAGVIQANGTITLDSTLYVGGGYGSTGVTISGAGVIQANGALTSDGVITGASFITAANIGIVADSDLLVLTANVLTVNGAITGLSTISSVGNITAGSGGDFIVDNNTGYYRVKDSGGTARSLLSMSNSNLMRISGNFSGSTGLTIDVGATRNIYSTSAIFSFSGTADVQGGKVFNSTGNMEIEANSGAGTITLDALSATCTVPDDTYNAGFYITNTDGQIWLVNGTATANEFAPFMGGIPTGDHSSLQWQGRQAAGQGATTPSFAFVATNAAANAIRTATHDLFAIQNWTTRLFTVTGEYVKCGDSVTNYSRFSTTGDQTFVGSAGFYPRTVEQATEPAAGTGATQIDSGEFVIWIDTDDSDKVYFVYNHGGTVVTQEVS